MNSKNATGQCPTTPRQRQFAARVPLLTTPWRPSSRMKNPSAHCAAQCRNVQVDPSCPHPTAVQQRAETSPLLIAQCKVPAYRRIPATHCHLGWQWA